MFNRVNLNGTWQLCGYQEGHNESPQVGPVSVTVPGGVLPALAAAGVIPDHLCGTNVRDTEWAGEKEWRYSRTFTVPVGFTKKKSILTFHRLDARAVIRLNGVEIGRTDNRFIPHSFDVTKLIRDGEGNEISVLLSGAGICRGVDLVSYDQLAVSDLYIQPVFHGRDADAWIYITVENFTEYSVNAQLVVIVARGDDREKVEFYETIPPGGDVVESVIRIEDPELWYPNGVGDQPLYTAMVGLSVEGEIQDVREEHFGIRSISLLEQNDVGEPRFILNINGGNVFCRGANWVPADCSPDRVTPERYRELLQKAVDAGINMLRVWGDGLYEDNLFYQLCDELGIMVWQDLMFLNSEYQNDEEFHRETRTVAEYVVKSLRNHPSIVLWGGGDENEIRKGVVDILDGTRPYRTGRPFDETLSNPNCH